MSESSIAKTSPHKYIGTNWKKTKAAILWAGMTARCVVGGAQQLRSKQYVGCSLSSEFARFEGFYDWYKDQPAFNLDGYEIDKDLIFKGNKIYSRETCFLIPKSLNIFLSSKKSNNRECPPGARTEAYGRFSARIRIDSKSRNLGAFRTAEEAGDAYARAKNSETKRWVGRLTEGEFKVSMTAIQLVGKVNWGIKNEQ